MKKITNDFGTYRKQCLEGKVLEINKERGGAKFKIDDIDGGVKEISAPFIIKPEELVGHRVFYVLEEKERTVEKRTGECYFDNDGVGFIYKTEIWIDAKHAMAILEGPAIGRIYCGEDHDLAGESDIDSAFLKGRLK